MDDLNARLFETTRRLHKGKVEAKKSKNVTQMRQYVGSSNHMFEDSQKTTKDYFKPTHDIKVKDKKQKSARITRTYHPTSRKVNILDDDLHRFYSSYGDYCQMCGSYHGSHLRGCSCIPLR